MDLEVGTNVGKYVLMEFLGQGSYGQVWKAQHSIMRNHQAALKVLHPEKGLQPESVERFLREADILASLGDHPNIVHVFDVDQHQDRYFIVMEYVRYSLSRVLGEQTLAEGETMGASRQGSRRLSLLAVLRLMQQICLGLEAAHEKGMVHRDLKPANVLLTEKGKVRLCDFGIAHLQDNSGMTGTGMGMGTLGYSAPEVLMGGAKEADPRADIYSAGALLYRMLTGEMVMGLDRPSELNPEIPTWLDEVIVRCMRRNMEDRYRDVRELKEELKEREVKPVLSEEEMTALLGRNSDEITGSKGVGEDADRDGSGKEPGEAKEEGMTGEDFEDLAALLGADLEEEGDG